MRLCADAPQAREGLREGSLTLSAAAELRGRSPGSAGAGRSPAPLRSHRRDAGGRLRPAVPLPSAEPEPPPPLVLDAVGRQKLVEEAAGKSARQSARCSDLDPELAPPADRVRPRSATAATS